MVKNVYRCDKCRILIDQDSIDIGLDLETIGAKCSCGGNWKKLNPETCPVCDSKLSVSTCVDDDTKERYICPNYPHCPTMGSRRKIKG